MPTSSPNPHAGPAPDDPYLELWHAHDLLREVRGDGHISVLMSEDPVRLPT